MPKENLLWKLDLLESQLREDKESSTRLKKTKFAVEKKNKNGHVSASQVEKEIVNVKRTLVDRKIHHGIQSVQRAVKKALTVEALKIQKRIKSTEDQNKIKSLNEELESVKNKFKSLELANIIVLNSIFKSFLKNYSKTNESPSFLSDKVIKDSVSQKDLVEKWQTSQKNVYGRLCNTASVKTSIQQMITSIKLVGGLIDKNVLREERMRERETEGKSDTIDKVDKVTKSIANEDSDLEEFDNNTNDHLVAGSDEEASEDESLSESESESESEQDDFFASSTGDLPSLTTGYISGSDDEDNYDYDNDSTVKAVTTERKNRRGQRARRKIWELKYGSNAKHVQKEKEERKHDYEVRQQAFENRQARRAQKQANEPPKEIKPSFDEKPIHPSWEAKKKISATAKKFEGKKIKF